MISLKSPRDMEKMRKACRIASDARTLAGSMVKPGITTLEIDRAVCRYMEEQGAIPSFLGYNGYPAGVCISVNDEVIHGIPGSRVLCEGDVVSIDVGAIAEGFHGDCAETFPCGAVSAQAEELIAVTRQSFWEAMKVARRGFRVGDISNAVQSYVEEHGYAIVRDYVGHGVGTQLHEPPEVPNFGAPGRGPRLMPGMTLAVEPMVNAGEWKIRVLEDGWTVKTIDGSLSAHYENSILITKDEPEILTISPETQL